MKVSGTSIGVIELVLFFYTTTKIRNFVTVFNDINRFSYYWLSFTVLTGIWELTYVINRDSVRRLASYFIRKKIHVWTNMYGLDLLLPWKLSKQFYTEYGAYADREYISNKDGWSLIIEGSHCMLCGIFAMLALGTKLTCSTNTDKISCDVLYHMFMSVSMASQFMNSLLYMAEYFIQTTNVDSVNYNSKNFPCGFALSKRPFMYINAFWMIMPTYVFVETLYKV